KRLVVAEDGRHVAQARELRLKIQHGQSVVTRQLRNSSDPQLAFNIVDVGELVDPVHIVAAPGETQRVKKQSLHCRVAEIGIHVVDCLLAAKSWEGIQHGVAEIVEDESPVDALRPLAALLLARLLSLLPLLLADAERSQQASLITEAVIEADEHGVRAAWRGGNEVKIVAGTGQIGQRNESKQLRRRGINAGDGVAGDRQMRDGIEELPCVCGKIS